MLFVVVSRMALSYSFVETAAPFFHSFSRLWKETTMAAAKKTESKFDIARTRALKGASKGGGVSAITDDPFVLGAEEGFDPPIEVEKFTFSKRIALARAMQRADREDSVDAMVEAMQILFGRDVLRVFAALDKEGDDAELIAGGLLVSVLEHFYGDSDEVGNFFGLLR